MEDVLKRMEHQFIGLSCVELSQIYQLMLRVQALHSLTAMDQSTDVGQLCSTFLAILNRVSEYVVSDTYHHLTHCHTHT